MADMRNLPNIQELVFQKVKQRTPDAENARTINVQKRFLDGTLYTVNFTIQNPDGTQNTYANRVFVRKNSIDVYGIDEDVFRIVGETHSRSFYDVFANGDVVSGIIALVVTLLIVPSFIASFYFGREIVVPEWITSGWLLILGFYFGKASSKGD